LRGEATDERLGVVEVSFVAEELGVEFFETSGEVGVFHVTSILR
jgi:hypothetical protein